MTKNSIIGLNTNVSSIKKSFSLHINNYFSSKYLKYILFILPSIYGLLSFYCYFQSKSFFTTYPDSIYIYLINGTNIAGGNFDIGHYDNPGTPVHWLAGIIIFITHLFTDQHPVYESVLANPEYYLRVCVIVVTIFLLLSIYLSGRLILKHTGNIFTALFFQLIPVCSYFLIHYLLLIRVTPENLIIICLTYYYSFLWVMCYKKEANHKNIFSQRLLLFIFSFTSAFLVTTKITCLPFLILPFFFIENNYRKLIYIVLTTIFAAILIYPIWPKLPDMYNWFITLATHSGEYGHGKAEISVSSLLSNFVKLLKYELFFSIGYIFLSISVITGFILKKWNNYFYKLTVAFWIICTGQLFLASKQFGHHYLIASQMLIIPGTIAAYKALINKKINLISNYILLIIFIGFFTFKINQVVNEFKGGNKFYESSLNAKKYANIPKIITTGYQGSCFVESALRFGASYGGSYYHSSNYFLRTLYPNSYFYDLYLSNNYVKWWDVIVTPQELFENNPKILIYFVREDEATEKQMIKNITNGLESVIKSVDVIDYNEATGEKFYMLTIDTSKTKSNYVKKINVKYDFEKTTNDESAFVSSDKNFTLSGVEFRSKEKSFSGNQSIKIPPGQYACCSTLVVNPGDAFDISVNYYSTDRPVGITLTSFEIGLFDRWCESIVNDFGNGWRKINLKGKIPNNSDIKELKFCLYYFGNKTCYIDNLSISFYKQFATPTKFILKTSNKQYISLSHDKSGLLESQSDVTKAEIFEIIDLGKGKSALKASNGKFVSADYNLNSKLYANRDNAWDWETFEIVFIDKTKINLKSSNGKFVCAEQNGTPAVVANRDIAQSWETFSIETQ